VVVRLYVNFKYLDSKIVILRSVKEEITDGIKDNRKFYQLVKNIIQK
jgi:hypothetical protein